MVENKVWSYMFFKKEFRNYNWPLGYMFCGIEAQALGVPELQVEPPGIQGGPPGTWTVTHFIS